MKIKMFCPCCGREHSIEEREKIKCECSVFLTLTEQYHANGYQILVRYD